MRISDWSSDVCSSDLQTFAESHERRLEAMRRLTRNVVREPDGSWIIAPDHLDRAAAHEAARTKDRPVIVDSLSPLPLEKLVDADAATWLDRELLTSSPEPLPAEGVGNDVPEAQDLRRPRARERGGEGKSVDVIV